jgi:hypothetical protein
MTWTGVVPSDGCETTRVCVSIMNETSAHSGSFRSITLRRDSEGALKFNGERIGAATRVSTIVDNDGEETTYSISARLFKTSGGKFVMGVEVYNKTDETYESRFGDVGASLEALLEKISRGRDSWTDDDLLGELFESTEIADKFVEHVD